MGLVLPVQKLQRISTGSRFRYRHLSDDADGVVTVVVGKEKREFLVDPFVLEENPFRVLIGSVNDGTERRLTRVVKLDHIDSILFEHLLWLLHNDLSSFLKIDLHEIIDFYSQDC